MRLSYRAARGSVHTCRQVEDQSTHLRLRARRAVNEFSKFQPFTNRLDHIGHYYGEYARLMAHWERVAGDRVATIHYESFIADFDRAAPALLQACGLQWEEACRDFQTSWRAIATLSTVQAREPVADRSFRPSAALRASPRPAG